MLTILTSKTFDDWMAGLRDAKGKIIILKRLERMKSGNLGDAKSVGDKVSEVRIDFGPGYRLYYTRKGETLIVLLVAGDKSSQARDVAAAKEAAVEWNQ